MTPAERRLQAQMAANTRWGSTSDRSEATEPARRGLRAKFELEVDPDGSLDPAERERRVNSLVKAHMQRMSLAASRARKAKASGS